MSQFRYRAFISYSHADADQAAWLQRQLESYRVPARIARRLGMRSLGTFFRDRDELPAGSDLSDTIRQALSGSEFLIVICSPAARRSEWVNREIAEFRRLRGGRHVLCVIADGIPHGASSAETAEQECFPPALEFEEEPIAADLRPDADGRRLAKLKIVAGLLGVGLDEIVQREAQRRQRTLLAVSVASFTGMLVLGGLALIALDARQDEQLRRAEAEDLIEFMLSDLRGRLDAVGRLDVLDAVGKKTIDYYAKASLADLNEDSLGRRARAFHLLGEVDERKGDIESARTAFEEAHNATGELLQRSPDDGERIFDHAQSVFWVGYLDWRLGNDAPAKAAFEKYLRLARKLQTLDPDNSVWRAEAGHANLNLGVYTLERGDPADAAAYFQASLDVFSDLSALEPSRSEWIQQSAQAHAWLSDAYRVTGPLEEARAHRMAEIDLYREMLAHDPDNQRVNRQLIVSYHTKAELQLFRGDPAAAVEDLESAARYGDALLRLEPDDQWVLAQTVSVYGDLTEALTLVGDLVAASRVLERANGLAGRLDTTGDDVLHWQQILVTLDLQRAKLHMAHGREELARQRLDAAAAELQDLAAKHPGIVAFRHALAEALFHIGRSHPESTKAFAEHMARVVALLEPDREMLPLVSLALLHRAYRAMGLAAGKVEEIGRRLHSLRFRHPEFVSADGAFLR